MASKSMLSIDNFNSIGVSYAGFISQDFAYAKFKVSKRFSFRFISNTGNVLIFSVIVFIG